MDDAESYRLIVERMPALICRFGPDGVLKYVNRAYCDYFDTPKGELVGQEFFRFIPKEERDAVRQKFESLTPFEPEVTYEHQVLDPKGHARWQRWTDRALYEDGDLVEYQSIGYDITAQKEAEEELRELSYSDHLTGIANRRKFEEFLEQDWKRTSREVTSTAVVVGDIDFFKAYNDSFGHQKGDECLQRVAQVFAHGLQRASDLAARIGGEEFAALLPGTTREGARSIAESIRAKVKDLKIKSAPEADHPLVTISLGVACGIPSRNLEPQDLLQKADDALYAAKQGGRDRVELAPESDRPTNS